MYAMHSPYIRVYIHIFHSVYIPYIRIQYLYGIYKESRKAIYTPYTLHTYVRRINICTELANPINQDSFRLFRFLSDLVSLVDTG